MDQAEVIIAAVDALPTTSTRRPRPAQAHAIGYAAEHDVKVPADPRQTDPRGDRTRDREPTKRRSSNARNATPRRLRGSGWSRTVTASATEGSPSQHPRRDAEEGPDGLRRPQAPGLVTVRHPNQDRPSDHRMGQAFMEYVEPLPYRQAPSRRRDVRDRRGHHDPGDPDGRPQAAQLDTGHRISPGLARKLACEAGIIPAVLGSKSQVLDLGRNDRFHTKPSGSPRLEQGGCTSGLRLPTRHVPRPPRPDPGHRGGATDLKQRPPALPQTPRQSTRPEPTRSTKLPEGKVASTADMSHRSY